MQNQIVLLEIGFGSQLPDPVTDSSNIPATFIITVFVEIV
jgi:hypothetical protein